MSDVEIGRCLERIEQRLLTIEAWMLVQTSHDEIDHAHVHDGYVTTARLTAELEALKPKEPEKEEPKESSEEEDDGKKEKPVASEEKSEDESKKEETPSSQGAPERRHALHRRIGGKKRAA